MRLDDLVGGVGVLAVIGDGTVDVTGVTHDSRAVEPGALFCCVPGQVTDGHAHAPAAVRAGAVALLVERPLGLGVTEVVVDDVRRSMGRVAAAYHGHPSRRLQVAGITGTNGKTTTAALLQAILTAAGRRSTMIGTLTGTRTTPESTELQAQLAGLLDAGMETVAMEVSSHALALHRVEGMRFAVGIFTNLSRDHLEFHASMEEYFAAKARLFDPDLTASAVINRDSPHGRLLLDAARVPSQPYSLEEVTDLEVGMAASMCRWRGLRLVVPLAGAFNVSNALAAIHAALVLGVDEATAVAGVAGAGPVRGRFEPVDVGQPFAVVVDFAHTPDGLEQLLRNARGIVGDGARVAVVFGCGGDRDRTKRPLMGEVASRLADRVVITSDNPRREDPQAIIEAVRAGATGPADVTIEPDRRAAIIQALRGAARGDVIVVAGKGHETTQTIGDRVLPFDDRVVVAEELARLGWGGEDASP